MLDEEASKDFKLADSEHIGEFTVNSNEQFTISKICLENENHHE